MAFDPVTNTVTPVIGGVGTVWCDPRAGKSNPQYIKGPYEGATNPQEITISITQTNTKNPYLAAATLVRSSDVLELYRDPTLKESTKLVFCENQARLSNSELTKVGGTKFYAKGTCSAVGQSVNVDLTLQLDPLETAECKYTDFSAWPLVANEAIKLATNGTVKRTVKVAAGDMVFPVIAPQSADVCIRPGTSPLAIAFSLDIQKDITRTPAFAGEGVLTLSPKDALVKFYTDEACQDDQELKFQQGIAKLSSVQLTNGVTLYALAADNSVSGHLQIALDLKSTGDTKSFIPAEVAHCSVLLEAVNSVTPTLRVDIDEKHEDTLWYPALVVGKMPTLKLGIKETKPSIPYNGNGLLVRSNAKVSIFHDQGLTKPVSFVENKAIISHGDLMDADKVYYLKGNATGDAELKLQLYQPTRKSVHVTGTAQSAVSVKQVSYIDTKVSWSGGSISRDEPVTATTSLTANPDNVVPYTGKVILQRSDLDLLVFDAQEKKVFGANATEVALSQNVLRDNDNTFTVLWGGQEDPADELTLVLSLPDDIPPYFITNKESQLRPAANEVVQNVMLQDQNDVAAVIQTDFDLVLKSTGFQDGEVSKQTSSTFAYIGVTQSKPALGYNGNGILTRENGKVRVYTDEACTQELPFYNGSTVIPNADLLNADKRYYLTGYEAGKTKLTLTLESGSQSDYGLSRYKVTGSATQELTVIGLVIELFHDVAAVDTAVSSAMSDRAKRLDGRALHLPGQDADLGRAKINLQGFDVANWPGNAKKHVVTLNVKGNVAVMSKPEDGDIKAEEGTILSLGEGELGGEKPYWLSLKQLGDVGLRGELIMIGLDRTDKDTAKFPGAPNAIKPKSYGDWCAATGVRFVQLTPNTENWRQYTNQPIDRTVTRNTNLSVSHDGQHLLVTATIDPAVPGVGVDFMLWKDPANLTDVPPATVSMPLTHHRVGVTDENGQASVRLKLSRFGGDKFKAVCFLAADAVKGLPLVAADITKFPASQVSQAVTVWRKLSYDLLYMKRHASPSKYKGDLSNMFCPASMASTFEESFLELHVENRKIIDNVPVLYSTGFVGAGLKYRTWLAQEILNGVVQEPKDRFFTLVFIEAIGSRRSSLPLTFTHPTATGNIFKYNLGDKNFDISNKNYYLKTGSCKLSRRGTLFNISDWEQNIPDGKVTVVDGPDGSFELQIDLNGINRRGRSLNTLVLEVELLQYHDSCGVSLSDKATTFSAVRYAERRGFYQSDEVYSTAVHEVGHYLGLTSEMEAKTALPKNLLWYYGGTPPNKTSYYVVDNTQPSGFRNPEYGNPVGQGPHCMKGYAGFNELLLKMGDSSIVDCLMYHATVDPPITKVCATCKSSARAHEYALANTSDSSPYS